MELGKSKRTFKQYDVAKIVNEDGAELIFDIQPCDDPDDNWVHVCMFSIPVKKQKGFFQTKMFSNQPPPQSPFIPASVDCIHLASPR